MSKVLLVHGIAQQYRGPESLRAACAPALCDGVALAGGRLEVADVAVAFYGDLFRPAGSRGLDVPDYDVTDLADPLERDLLRTWWYEAARTERGVEDSSSGTRGRTPQWVQRALHALSGSVFFGGLAERVLIGNLKQTHAYFADAGIRKRIQRRVLAAMTAETRVIVGHSLGSVVAYEALCAMPGLGVSTFVTLGSPLGVPKLIFDRLLPRPKEGRGRWPTGIRRWTNVADDGDIVALTKALAPLFGPEVRDVLVHNGAKAHDVRPYLTAKQTGLAVLQGLVGDGP
ncbi:hypothetical protein [Amycolatopsis sp. NPDC049868]|uniref:hypothetical protein n=1 Tax=Amycolatopsis sp. NPDC049868 TaxID=3363934 RepID=UPI0037931F67